jgi:polyisoprenoid-binding protein YceI
MGNKIGFVLEGKINRTDFGLKWNKAIELGGVAVGEEVKIKVDVEAEKK